MKYASIAFKNLNRQKKRSILLGGAIAFGIMIITLVNSLTAGVSAILKDNFSSLMGGHIFVTGETSAEGSDTVIDIMEDDTILADVLNQLGYDFDTLAKRSTLMGELIFESESAQSMIDGIRWDEEQTLQQDLVLKEGTLEDVMNDPRGIILSDKTAKDLGIALGEAILVRTRTESGQQNVGEFTLKATIADSGLLGSMRGYAGIEYINELLAIKKDAYQSVSIFATSVDTMDIEGDAIYDALEKANANLAPRIERQNVQINNNVTFDNSQDDDEEDEEWSGFRYNLINMNDFLDQVDQILGFLNSFAYGVLFFLLLIIVIGIMNTFRMVMYERIKEIGTMRAVGMQRNVVRRIFLYEAVFLAVLGVAGGVILAMIAMGGFSLIDFGVESDFSLFLNNGHLAFKMVPASIIVNLVLISIITLLAALLPANKASKLRPADALRSNK